MSKRFLLAALVVAGVVSVVPARVAAPANPVIRMAGAEVTVVGKVTGFADKLVNAETFKGDTQQMQIATVKVEEAVLGKPAREIKVGFIPAAGGGRRLPGSQLSRDQEGVLFLNRHPTKKDLYVLIPIYGVIDRKGNPEFKKTVEELRATAKLLANPLKGLKSKDAEERYATAALLVTRYRTPNRDAREVQVSAEESKLILTAFAEADWARTNPRYGYQLSPRVLFPRLGLTAKDGWKFEGGNYQEAAQAWLKENAGKYRIKRYKTADGGTDPEPEERKP